MLPITDSKIVLIADGLGLKAKANIYVICEISKKKFKYKNA